MAGVCNVRLFPLGCCSRHDYIDSLLYYVLYRGGLNRLSTIFLLFQGVDLLRVECLR